MPPILASAPIRVAPTYPSTPIRVDPISALTPIRVAPTPTSPSTPSPSPLLPSTHITSSQPLCELPPFVICEMSNTNLGVQNHGFIFVPQRPQVRHHLGVLDIYRRGFALRKEMEGLQMKKTLQSW